MTTIVPRHTYDKLMANAPKPDPGAPALHFHLSASAADMVIDERVRSMLAAAVRKARK